MTSENKKRSNLTNAQKSTGPTSQTGKAVASQNAKTHGVLSAKLFLEDEDPSEFDGLLQSLIHDLRPAGALELILVERVTVAIWKQRRLNRAESASIELEREKRSLKQLVGYLTFDESMEYANSDYVLLKPGEYESYDWLPDLLAELAAISRKALSIAELNEVAPHIRRQLELEARGRNRTVEDHLSASYKGDTPEQCLQSFLTSLSARANEQWASLGRRKKLTALERHDRSSRSIPKTPELMTRYQVALDNELYKALKALREAQSWRLNNLEQVPE